MKKLICFILIFIVTLGICPVSQAADIPAPSYILVESSTFTVLKEKNAHERLCPASVTKIMTMLLVMEAIDSGSISLSDIVTTSGHASSMGGSQIYLSVGEQMTVDDMLKAVAVASANDAAVALAEFIGGSEANFVDMMNTRAHELGMKNTTFKNPTGLHEDGHITTAYDIALMSCELLKHETITNYTTIWTDTLRNGSWDLANTNKLVRYYDNCTGLKTGFTDNAGFCLSASAKRDGMSLIAVVLNCDTTDNRFNSARSLLDYGFSKYCITPVYPDDVVLPIPVILGKKDEVQPIMQSEEYIVIDRASVKDLKEELLLCDSVEAPVEKGQVLGTLTVTLHDKILKTVNMVAYEDIKRLSFFDIFLIFLSHFTKT